MTQLTIPQPAPVVVRAHASSVGSPRTRTAPLRAGRPLRAARRAVRLLGNLHLVVVLAAFAFLAVGSRISAVDHHDLT